MKRIIRLQHILFAVALWVCSLPAMAQRLPTQQNPFPNATDGWAERTLAQMSLEEKLGQLFMVAAYTDKNDNQAHIERLIENHHLGGVIFMQGTPGVQLSRSNHYQSLSKYPLLVAQDAEWGPSMRLDSMLVFPKNMTLGAVQDDSLLYQYGKVLARQCRAVGVQVNFAPVVDVNNNPQNPVINYRSFGDDPNHVARRGLMVMRGMQDHGVIAVAKHFPGHGDTDTDSHLDLPVIRKSRSRLEQLEMHPFQQLIKKGVQGVMTAHLYVPALDNTPNLATTLSRKVVNDILVDSLGFNGLIFTDALQMQGVAKFFRPGEVDYRALKAGNDVLLFSQDVPRAIRVIKDGLQSGDISMEIIDRHVLKILKAKEEMNLHQQRTFAHKQLEAVLNSADALLLRRELYRAALTLVKNEAQVLPFKNLAQQRVAYIQVGYTNRNAPFYDYLAPYKKLEVFRLPKNPGRRQVNSLVERLELEGYTQVVLGVFQMSEYPAGNYGISGLTIQLMRKLYKNENLASTVVLFGSPYAVDVVPGANALLVAYEENEATQQAAAEVIYGAYIPVGELPVGVKKKFKPTERRYDLGAGRFAYARPEDVGMDSRVLRRLDTIANNYIDVEAMPGIVIAVARGNNIVFNKAYGNATYAPSREVDELTTVYDLASVTKVAATTLMAMRLYEQGKLNLNATLAHYLPELKGDEKANIRVIQLLQHQAGFIAHYPFYKKVVEDGNWDPNVLRPQKNEDFSIPIGKNVYLHKEYPDSVFRRLLWLEANPKPKYVYSDIDMMLLGEILQRITNEPLETYLQREFYGPMGMDWTMFNPAMKNRQDIDTPPTAVEDYFRFGRVEGFVNDDNAALFGGVAGHAGLFSNSYDLLKLGIMLKNCGAYGHRNYLMPETVQYFTSKNNKKSRRGLGWDKAPPKRNQPSPTSEAASPSTYGHLGFTGTAWWIDPENDLVIVILTNRTYPNAWEKTQYSEESVRTQITDVIYRSLKTPGSPLRPVANR